MRMNTLMDEVMKDNTLGLEILTPVISSRDNINLKSPLQLIEQENKKKNSNDESVHIELNHSNDHKIIKFPTKVSTRSGRIITTPNRLTY